MFGKKRKHSGARRDLFRSRFGFILACIGSAVGMGNIWLFPRRVAAYGAPFLAAYLLCVIVIGFSGVIGEMSFGRSMRAGTMGAFEGAMYRRDEMGMRGSKGVGTALSALPVLGSLALAIGYSVVVGWIIKYLFGTISGSALAATSVDEFWGYFGATASGFGNIGFHLLGLVITFLILIFGVSQGIEKANKVFMPLFFALFIGVAIYVSTLSGAADGYRYMFASFDWNTFASGEMWKYALGQAFFSLSLAGSGTLVYGSYIKDDVNVPRSAAAVALFDTLAAFVAALAIIPAVYSAGIDFNAEITSGPGLMFVYLPKIFRQMPGGRIVSVIFFVAVLFAGLSSLINLFEAPIEALQTKFRLKRIPAVSLVMGAGTVIAIFITDIVSDWMDICSIYICPIGALLAAVMFFWVSGKGFAEKEISKSCANKNSGVLFANLGRYVFCGLTLLVLILGSITQGGIG